MKLLDKIFEFILDDISFFHWLLNQSEVRELKDQELEIWMY